MGEMQNYSQNEQRKTQENPVLQSGQMILKKLFIK